MKKINGYCKKNKLQVSLLCVILLCCIWLCSLLVGKLMYIPKEIVAIQTLPVVLITLSTFTQVILYAKDRISRQQIVMLFVVSLLFIYPQVIQFISFSEFGIATFDMWLLVLLFILIAIVSVVFAYTSKLENSFKVSEKTKITAATIGTAIIVLEMLFLSIVSQQKKIEIAHYFAFITTEFIAFSLVVLMYAYIYREQRTIAHVVTSCFLLVLAITLSFPTALNSVLLYKNETNGREQETKGTAIYVSDDGTVTVTKRVDKYWAATYKANVRIEGRDVYVDGKRLLLSGVNVILSDYEKNPYPDRNHGNNIQIKAVQKTNEKIYIIDIEYYSLDMKTTILTREVWETNVEGDLVYSKPVAKDTKPYAYGSNERVAQITPNDMYSRHFSKKVGENTLRLEFCTPNVDIDKYVSPCITIRDKDNNVIISGIEYNLEKTMQNEKITGIVRVNEDENDVYTFNDDGTYTVEKAKKNQTNNCPKEETNIIDVSHPEGDYSKRYLTHNNVTKEFIIPERTREKVQQGNGYFFTYIDNENKSVVFSEKETFYQAEFDSGKIQEISRADYIKAALKKIEKHCHNKKNQIIYYDKSDGFFSETRFFNSETGEAYKNSDKNFKIDGDGIYIHEYSDTYTYRRIANDDFSTNLDFNKKNFTSGIFWEGKMYFYRTSEPESKDAKQKEEYAKEWRIYDNNGNLLD